MARDARAAQDARTGGARRLRLVTAERAEQAAPARARAELAPTLALLAASLVPLAGELLQPGRWSAGIVGFATATALLAGHELWQELRR